MVTAIKKPTRARVANTDAPVLMPANGFRTDGLWRPRPGEVLTDGSLRTVGGHTYIHYDGCWIHYYEPPPNTLENKRQLINHLTRRTFHHTEPGINTPGDRLTQAREAWEAETDPHRKRVNAAMLAGALFNHATDIFTAVVELESKGVEISRSNELMKECGACFKEALELGKQVKHHSGEEGIDELWGEPFRAFTITLEQFYTSRYIKIAQTWKNIDKVADIMENCFCDFPAYDGLHRVIAGFAVAAKRESETMKSDEHIFQVWPEFVAAGEHLEHFEPHRPAKTRNSNLQYTLLEGRELVRRGKNLINWIASARVPMPKSTADYATQCERYHEKLTHAYGKR
ncbi:hypothetical protein Q4485_16850 [Granulosicoccaceae sp. 1_MG-2023]|nr:hypothetical protein [Granulosicoccaceae sp. 1_MG-2023]